MLTLYDGEPPETISPLCPLSLIPILDRCDLLHSWEYLVAHLRHRRGSCLSCTRAPVGVPAPGTGFWVRMTCWRRLRDWQEAGVWQHLHEALLAELNAAGPGLVAGRHR